MTRFEAKAKARARRKQTRKKQAGAMQAQAIVTRLRHKGGATYTAGGIRGGSDAR